MRQILKSLIAGGALALAGAASAAPPPEARLERLLEGRVAGKPVNCINQRDIWSAQIIDKTAIVYRVGAKLYVNRPRSGASWLDRDDILVTQSFGTSQLCRIDFVRLVDRTALFPSGFVTLGEFVPYSRAR
jgi:hypothetical protein